MNEGQPERSVSEIRRDAIDFQDLLSIALAHGGDSDEIKNLRAQVASLATELNEATQGVNLFEENN